MHILNTLQQSDSIQTKVIKRLYSNQRNKFSRLTIIILLSSNAHSHNIGDNLRLHNSKNSTNCTQFIEINVLYAIYSFHYTKTIELTTWTQARNKMNSTIELKSTKWTSWWICTHASIEKYLFTHKTNACNHHIETTWMYST